MWHGDGIRGGGGDVGAVLDEGALDPGAVGGLHFGEVGELLLDGPAGLAFALGRTDIGIRLVDVRDELEEGGAFLFHLRDQLVDLCLSRHGFASIRSCSARSEGL